LVWVFEGGVVDGRGSDGSFGVDEVALCQGVYGEGFLGGGIEDYWHGRGIRSWGYYSSASQGTCYICEG
jgi:hypothetical protein